MQEASTNPVRPSKEKGGGGGSQWLQTAQEEEEEHGEGETPIGGLQTPKVAIIAGSWGHLSSSTVHSLCLPNVRNIHRERVGRRSRKESASTRWPCVANSSKMSMRGGSRPAATAVATYSYSPSSLLLVQMQAKQREEEEPE